MQRHLQTGMLSVGIIGLLIYSLIACKPLVRQETSAFQPRATTSQDGELVARQIVLLVNDDANNIEQLIQNDPNLEEKLDRIAVTVGRKNSIIDGLRDFFFSIPGKLILWDRSVGQGELHEDAQTAVKLALLEGDSPETHVSINEYNPKLIWSRMFKNDKASFLSKVSIGTLNALIYTVIPRRLFGGDAYFPIADTVVLYSDNLDIALHEAGHAIDFSEKQREGIGPGLYVIIGRFVFPITLYQEAVATGKAFSFTKKHGTSADLQSSYALLFPAFGTYLGASILAANKLISRAKVRAGKQETALTQWFNKRKQALMEWQINRSKRITVQEVEQSLQAIERYGKDAYKHYPRSIKKIAKRSQKVLRFAVIIPVVVAAHIVGRAMGSRVKTPNDQHINPKFE